MTTDPWWTVIVGAVRIGVQAPNEPRAWSTFVSHMHPSLSIEKYGRRMPPDREDCIVRRATSDEIFDYAKRNKRAQIEQKEHIFDPTSYDKKVRHRD